MTRRKVDYSVNRRQSRATARRKYAYARARGITPIQASRMRSWRWETILAYLREIRTTAQAVKRIQADRRREARSVVLVVRANTTAGGVAIHPRPHTPVEAYA